MKPTTRQPLPKRVLCAAMSVAMAVSLMPLPAYAGDAGGVTRTGHAAQSYAGVPVDERSLKAFDFELPAKTASCPMPITAMQHAPSRWQPRT